VSGSAAAPPGERGDATERQALSRLEAAVGVLLTERAELERRLQDAEERVGRLEELLRRFTRGEEDPATLQAQVIELRVENEALRTRMEEGREGIDRLLTQLRFLEEQR